MSNPVLPTDDATSDRGEVVVLNRDLYFGVRVGNTLRALGYRVVMVKETGAFVDRLGAAGTDVVLGVIDVNAGVDWQRIRALTAGAEQRTPILAFGPHKDVAGLRAAKEAGVRRVVSNGEFHRDLVGLVDRYALPRPRTGSRGERAGR